MLYVLMVNGKVRASAGVSRIANCNTHQTTGCLTIVKSVNCSRPRFVPLPVPIRRARMHLMVISQDSAIPLGTRAYQFTRS